MPRAKGGSIPPPRVNVQAGQGGPIAQLNENDVLSGRGGRINNHPGNITFRTIVEDYKHEYLDPRTRKLEKAHVAARLVSQIRSTYPPGRFLKEDPDNVGMFIEIGDQKAWKKAGQALREDAPDVRKEIDETLPTPGKVVKARPTKPPPQRQQPVYHQQQHHPHHRPGVPPGIPPSVSYSPTSAPMRLAPPSAPGGARPDPPEAEGVTGYRTAPLRYQGNQGYFESGRGGRIVGGRGFPQGRGRGGGRGPPPHHRPQQQGGYHHQNWHNHPPPPQMAPSQQPHPQQPHHQHYSHPHAPHSAPPQYEQHYQHHPHQYHPNQPPPQGFKAGQPQPQFTAQDGKHGKRGKGLPIPPIVGVVAHGVHQTMEGLTNKVKRRTVPQSMKNSRDSDGPDFLPHMSVGTDFTMSDISTFGQSGKSTPLALGNSVIASYDAAMKTSSPPRHMVTGALGESMETFNVPDASPKPYHQEEVAVSGDGKRQPKGETQGSASTDPNKQSSGTNSSSSKSPGQSMTMSELMGSGFSFGMSGRTRSFPDLMLSTGDLLPPMQSDSDREENQQSRNSSSGSNRDGVQLKPFHRQSSSESSGNMGGFHPVRRAGNNTGNNAILPNLNDAMSIMSLDSRKSMKSENSSWLENFRSMQSIHSDMNPWESTNSRGLSRKNNEMIINDGTDGSVRSFLSDVSAELNALDLAEPLLPPIDTETALNDSNGFMGMARPDP